MTNNVNPLLQMQNIKKDFFGNQVRRGEEDRSSSPCSAILKLDQLTVKYFSGISTSALPIKRPGLPMI